MKIRSFCHQGLEAFARTGATSGIKAGHAPKLNVLLTQLAFSADVPTLRGITGFHPVRRKFQSDLWSVKVNASWRLTFRIVDGEVCDLDYVQYH